MCLCTKIKCYLNVYVFLCFLIIMSMSVLVALALFHRVDCGCWACMSCVCKQCWHRRSYSHFSEYNKTLEYMSYSQAVVDLQKIFGSGQNTRTATALPTNSSEHMPAYMDHDCRPPWAACYSVLLFKINRFDIYIIPIDYRPL